MIQLHQIFILQEEKEDNNRPGNNEYWYDYLVRDGAQGLDLGQREARQGGLVRGGYHVLLPDRRTQLVQYWSDWSGYHPTVTYSYT
ncbi:unnamed protein product [Nezara viridula]|uniref:Uncharacterized protein n=1 Tax=Nezara viridula TaxID=85310 RepID=A0A9P0H652_NEZVI|nr:unnamed protein product [Nezara viridula]